MGDIKKPNVFQERQTEAEDNTISMKKSHFHIYIYLAFIAVFSIFNYVTSYKSNHSYETKYFEGYQMGISNNTSQMVGVTDQTMLEMSLLLMTY